MPFRGVEFREWQVSSLSSIMGGGPGIEWQLKQLTFRFSNAGPPDSSPTHADTLRQRFHKIKLLLLPWYGQLGYVRRKWALIERLWISILPLPFRCFDCLDQLSNFWAFISLKDRVYQIDGLAWIVWGWATVYAKHPAWCLEQDRSSAMASWRWQVLVLRREVTMSQGREGAVAHLTRTFSLFVLFRCSLYNGFPCN